MTYMIIIRVSITGVIEQELLSKVHSGIVEAVTEGSMAALIVLDLFAALAKAIAELSCTFFNFFITLVTCIHKS